MLAGEVGLETRFRFEVRLAEDEPAPHLRKARVAGSDRVLYLHADAILTNDDVARSRIIEADTPPRYAVAVEFTALGGQKMRNATARHLGRPVAILVDGIVVMAAIAVVPVDRTALIFTRADAERIAEAIGFR